MNTTSDFGTWEYFDPATVPAHARRRKQIGRQRAAGELATNALFQVFGQRMAAWLLDNIQADFFWLTDGTHAPSAWGVCLLENGCAYLVPGGNEPYRLHRSDRHFDEVVSADTAGLCATMFCLNRFSHHCANQADVPPSRLKALERGLATFSELHPEGRAIRAVLN
jgi:hypothetical protein